MIDPKAEPIGHRPPYKPVDVSGRKPVPVPAREAPILNWRELCRIANVEFDS